MPEVLLLAIGLLVAGAAVLAPLWRPPAPVPDDDAAALRHRVALEALRDVEADRRAGSLDDAAYAAQLADAEGRAAGTLAALDRRDDAPLPVAGRAGRTWPLVIAATIAGVLLIGSLVPATGIASRAVVDEALAAAEAAQLAREHRIEELTAALAEDPTDTGVLSDLADAYLAGSSGDDLVAAASALQLLIALEPERPDAYERIMSAYLRAGDGANARSAHDAYLEISTADPAEAAFFDGLIALRGENDPARAADAFDRFLELAPDDPRAEMVQALRDDASSAP
jgi:cytochrome c-type biogenesis protein CcmH/NrfG